MLTCKFSEFGCYCREVLLEAAEKVGITGAKEWLEKEVNFRFDDHMANDFGVIRALTCHCFRFLFLFNC